MSKSLYNLTNDYQQIQAMLDDETIDNQCAIDTLESIEGEIENKAENIFKVTVDIDNEVEAIKVEMARLAARKKNLETQKANLLTYLKEKLISIGKKKIKTPIVTISFRKGSESVKIVDIDELPDRFFKVVIPIPNKIQIKDAIRDGIEVPGVELVRGPESMVIK